MEPAVAVLVIAPVYFIPAIAAWARQYKSAGGILVLNAFLGWTPVGWVAALVWAAAGKGAAAGEAGLVGVAVVALRLESARSSNVTTQTLPSPGGWWVGQIHGVVQ